MLAIVLACILIAVLTYYQVFKQGLFSSLIMAVLSLAAALIALNYFEQLGSVLTGWGLAKLSPQAISLLGLFALSLLVMRLITDRLISGNMNFALPIDRVGAGLFGFVSSMVVVGMLALGFQLLAVGPGLLMYDRYDKDHDKYIDESGLFPYPDAFVTSLIANASINAFSGQRAFRQVHPEFLRELYLNRVTLDPGSRQEAGKDSMTLENVKMIGNRIAKMKYQFSGKGRNRKLVPKPAGWHAAAPGETLLIVSVRIRAGSGTKDDPGTQDVDNRCRYTMGSFRLVGFDDKEHSAGIARYPIGLIDRYKGKTAVELKGLDKGAVFSEQIKDVALVFEWPHKKANSATLEPRPVFLEFKRSVRVEIAKIEQKPSS